MTPQEARELFRFLIKNGIKRCDAKAAFALPEPKRSRFLAALLRRVNSNSVPPDESSQARIDTA